ncbi:MAG: sporadic carbohydrate cluster protein, LIC12192 family [Acidiferrobacteraceae bacterium]|nr:sporadic carbohydrate cluster protein, LIC12192 family [Acidiferrobacteraceae bacterium]
MTGYRGYISSRPFHGHHVPQRVQNLVIRSYCSSHNITLLLSATEYAMPDSFLILEDLIKHISALDGIVFYSILQLPDEEDSRNQIFHNVVNAKKALHFASESLSITNPCDIYKLQDIFKVRNIIDRTPSVNYLQERL